MPNKSSNQYIIALALIVIAIAGYFIGVSPIRAELETVKTEKEIAQNKKTNLEQKLENFKKIQAEIEKTSEVKQNSSINAIPENYNQDTLITTLTEKTQEEKMILNSISFSKGVPTDLGVNAATITMSLSGDYQRLVDFLRGLENEVQRKVVVKNISVELGEQIGSLREINFTITMEIYYQSEF